MVDSLPLVSAHEKLKKHIPLLRETCRSSSRWGAVKFALITRFIFLLAMMVSSALIPTFHAGDDVLTFDMRLQVQDWKINTDAETCFCIEGHVCEELFRTEHKQSQTRYNPLHPKCVDVGVNERGSNGKGSIKSQGYNLLLTPLTRWDAARFLSLAVDSKARYPIYYKNGECGIDQEIQGSGNTCQASSGDVFASSEQAHAFFPLFPLIIRYMALFLFRVVPQIVLPPTFEALAVLSGLIWNIVSFIVSALALQDLTYTLVHKSISDRNTSGENPDTSGGLGLDIVSSNMATILFCLNPATVFFIACYSESTFSCFTFVSYALFTKTLSSKRILLLICSTACWMLASYTRSNGSLASIFLFIHLCGMLVNICRERRDASFGAVLTALYKCCNTILSYAIPIICIVLPILYHDRRGFRMHCDGTVNPEWCMFNEQNFSLYGFVQDKYWNVGIFRYWTLPQLPNFLLAFPILSFGALAVMIWIRRSWNSFAKKDDHRFTFVSPLAIFQWAFDALAKITLNADIKNEDTIQEQVLFGQNMLAYYALLGGFTLLGLFIAHVQISTRMICSACPAIYWFMCSILFDADNRSKLANGNALICYLFSFHVLSVILHVNSLPWT